MKKILIFLLGIFILISFTGCGSSDDDKVTLRFSWWGNALRHEVTIEAVKNYMEKNPNVIIESEYGGFDGYKQKIVTQLAGGTAPDIMQLDAPWMSEFTGNDLLLNLYDYKEIIDMSELDQKFLKEYGDFNGNLVSMPTGVNGYVIMHNKDALDKYGITIPDNYTWDDLINVGSQLNKASNGKEYLFTGSVPNVRDAIFRIYMIQRIGTFMADDNYNMNFKEEDVLAAFKLIERLYDEKVVPSYEDTMPYSGNEKEYPGFVGGEINGVFELIAGISATKNVLPDKNWGILPYPIIEGAKDSGVWVRPAQVFSINGNTKHKEEAAKFLNYLFNDEEAIKILGTTRSTPPTKKAITILEKAGKLDATTVEATDVLMSNSGLRQNAESYEPTIMALENEMIEAIALGAMTPEEATKEYMIKYNQELNRLKLD